ncbi:MAG: hypothetical protein IJB70_01375 [Clostridia bacterium]|nr:hypothetical protein [Clostridia bacterium]
METLRDYVNWGLTHSDKTADAEGVPLVLENCVRNKKMKKLEVYGTDGGVGDVEGDKYKIPMTVRGKNVFDCVNSRSLFNANVSGSMDIIRTESDIMWTASANPSSVHMDMGLLSQYAGKRLTLSFEINLENNESVGNTRFVVCTENGQERSAVSGSLFLINGRRFITATIPNRNENDRLTLRLYINNPEAKKQYIFKNVMVSVIPEDVEFEPYIKSQTTNVYLDEPLRNEDVLDFRAKKVKRVDTVEDVECELPSLPAKTSIVEIDTGILPSNIKGKYIKR